jgi:putative DNA primase/helicase
VTGLQQAAADAWGLTPELPTRNEQHRGQVRIAYRLRHAYRHQLLHVGNVGWHVWDGTRWARDERGDATKAVLETLRAALAEAVELPKDDRDHLIHDVRRCESASGVDGVLRLAATLDGFAATTGDLDADPHLLNTTAGTLDLQTGAMRPHNPRDRITKVCGTGYDPTATAPTWTRFLEEVLPDPDVRGFLRRVIGLSLVGKVIEHVLPIATGTGRNGKGVFVRTVTAAFGDYAIEAEPELFLARDRAHPTGQLDLRGVRLATCQETDEGKHLAVATVKRLTGGDTIRARAMRQDFVEFRPSHLPVMVTNHLPRVPSDDPALWARLLVVPFDVSFLGREDPTLPERLELELPGVLAWAVAGYQDYTRERLNPPDAVTAATTRYHLSSDAVAQFVEDRCLVGPNFYARSNDLWAAWTEWCRGSSQEPGDRRKFKELLETRGYRSRKTKISNVFDGLALAETDAGNELS